jgi:hypothetical protein
MKIVYELNSSTRIVHIPDQKMLVRSNPSLALLTWDQFLTWVRDVSLPQGAINIKVVKDDDIPDDRTFRNALKPDLSFDKVKARQLTKERLKRDADAKILQQNLLQLDAEKAADIAKIKAEKTRLRDVTKNVTPDLTLDQLKNLNA